MGWIVHADAHLVVVDKPAGLLSVPGRGDDKHDCAWARVRHDWPDARIVHRLDMATSGLLLFALGLEVLRTLSASFELREVRKRYVAWVDGSPPAESGEIDLPLIADWPRRPLQKVDPLSGRPSLTRWRVLARGPGPHTRVEFEPLTGRSHQLRVHAAAAGWPIVGDRLYGKTAGPDAAPRLMLHASELALAHPIDGRPMSWIAPPPF